MSRFNRVVVPAEITAPFQAIVTTKALARIARSLPKKEPITFSHDPANERLIVAWFGITFSLALHAYARDVTTFPVPPHAFSIDANHLRVIMKRARLFNETAELIASADGLTVYTRNCRAADRGQTEGQRCPSQRSAGENEKCRRYGAFWP